MAALLAALSVLLIPTSHGVRTLAAAWSLSSATGLWPQLADLAASLQDSMAAVRRQLLAAERAGRDRD